MRDQLTIGRDFKVMVLVIFLLWCFCIFFPERPNARKAYEASLKGDLHMLRNAINQFHDDTGCFPGELHDLVAKDEKHLKAHVPKGKYQGPYLSLEGGLDNTGIPINPFTLHKTHDDFDITHHWRYDRKTGNVQSAMEGVTLKGKKYSEL